MFTRTKAYVQGVAALILLTIAAIPLAMTELVTGVKPKVKTPANMGILTGKFKKA
jgi:hypothetical protein